MKPGKQFGQDHIEELLYRIREIRASERGFYQKITDTYVQPAPTKMQKTNARATS
ncbi:MAG: virulence RhuM family protein [Flavobacteriales bacterium]|nr:virulence RhuM family protein [Flavobacteriales bacterium]